MTAGLNRPIFSVARVVEQGYHTHFGGDSPGLIVMTADNAGVTSNFVPFVRGENTDGTAGPKCFVSTIPMCRTVNMSFDINLVSVSTCLYLDYIFQVWKQSQQILQTPLPKGQNLHLKPIEGYPLPKGKVLKM